MKTLELTRADLKEEFQKVELLDITWRMVDWTDVPEDFDEIYLVDGLEFWNQKKLVEDEEFK